MLKSRLLVLGAGGLLGRALSTLGVKGATRQECDVTNPLQREALLDRHKPDAVLFCAAMTDLERCEVDPASDRVNVEAPLAWARRLPIWFISSNYVFSGPGPHLVDSPVAPIQRYGMQKATVEKLLLAEGSHVIRTGWLIGPGGRNFGSRLSGLLSKGPVRAAEDQLIQPTWAPDLAGWLLENLPEGLCHAIGRRETTWADLAMEIAHHMQLSKRVIPTPTAETHRLARRPLDARLSPALLPGYSRYIRRLSDPSRMSREY